MNGSSTDIPFEKAAAPVVYGKKGGILNAMTLDVEDYYHAHALESFFTRDTWPGLERRVAELTKELLDLFDAHDTKVTCFTLGSVAREYPELIRDIVARGHELASHGLEHYRASDQDHATFKKDVTDAKHALEDAGSVAVNGYRAASFSIARDNWWAFDVLEEVGYTYSSSVSAGKFTGLNVATPATPFFPTAGNIVECPITTVPVLGRAMPTGGGYFRLVPYRIFQRALTQAHRDRGQSANFYFHPWEIDPDQPKARVPFKTNFRHRVNLARMKSKVASALDAFEWGPMSAVFGTAIDSPRPVGQTGPLL